MAGRRVSQLGIAFVTGMLATVNPCGFAMLPAFLAFYVGNPGNGENRRPLLAGLRAGAAVSAGFAGVFTIAGLLLALGLRFVLGAVPWVAVGIGTVLVLAGIGLALGRSLPGGRLNIGRATGRLSASGTTTVAMAGYGAAYAVASLSCSLALLLAVVAQALATGSLTALLSIFAAYALGASSLLVLLAVAAAFARDSLARHVRRLLPVAGRLGGVALLAAGAYLITYWAPALAGGQAGGPISGVAAALSAAATAAVETNAQGIAIAAGGLMLLGALAVLTRRNHTNRLEDCCAPHSEPISPATESEQKDIH